MARKVRFRPAGPGHAVWCRAALATGMAVTLAALVVGGLRVGVPPAAQDASAWRDQLRRMDEALAGGEVAVAVGAWQAAEAAARQASGWEALVDAADAYLRIGDAVAFRRAFVDRARVNYRLALQRARREGSLEGVLRVAEALATLEEHPALEEAVGIARTMLAGNETAGTRPRPLADVAGEHP